MTRCGVRGSSWSWLVLFGLLPGLFDYLENYYLYQFVTSFPEIDPGQVFTANVLSMIKRGVLFLAVGVLVFAGIQKLLARKGDV